MKRGYEVSMTLVVPIVMTRYGKLAWEGNIVSPDQLIAIGYDVGVVLCYKIEMYICMYQCIIHLQKNKINK